MASTEGLRASIAPGTAIAAGYALFQAANSSVYLSRFSLSDGSFIFITDLSFNVASALATVLCALLIIVLDMAGKLGRFAVPTWPAAGLMGAALVVALTGSGLSIPHGIVFAGAIGLFSLGSIMAKDSWVELLALMTPARAVVLIGCSALGGAFVQYGLSFLSGPIYNAAVLGLIALSTWFLIVARRGSSAEALAACEPSARHRGRAALGDIGDALLAFCALEAVIGLINSFMLAASMQFAGAAYVPLVAVGIAALLFCLTSLIAQKIPAASAAFRMAFPIIAAMVVIVPFASDGYTRFFSTVLLTSYDFVALLIVYQVAHAARAFGASPYALFAFTAGCTKLCLLAALMLGSALGGPHLEEASSTVRFLVLSCGIIYLLSMAVVMISRDRGNGKRAHQNAAQTGLPETDIEPAGTPSAPAHDEAPEPALQPQPQPAPDPDAVFEATRLRLASEFGLTEREAEVLGYLARGRTNTYIADDLCISPTTVRGHIRHIYTKLDVHSKQEIIDLFQ